MGGRPSVGQQGGGGEGGGGGGINLEDRASRRKLREKKMDMKDEKIKENDESKQGRQKLNCTYRVPIRTRNICVVTKCTVLYFGWIRIHRFCVLWSMDPDPNDTLPQ